MQINFENSIFGCKYSQNQRNINEQVIKCITFTLADIETSVVVNGE